jgi:hypothetical protein
MAELNTINPASRANPWLIRDVMIWLDRCRQTAIAATIIPTQPNKALNGNTNNPACTSVQANLRDGSG